VLDKAAADLRSVEVGAARGTRIAPPRDEADAPDA